MDFIKICLHAMPLVSGIRNILIAKKFGVGAFMYYKKTFDTIDHKLLCKNYMS